MSKSAEELQGLGKQAAEGFTSRKYATLTTAVVQTVKQAGLNPNQIQRVVEFANKEAYLSQHQAKLAESERNIEFSGGPARATDVLTQLNSVPHRVIEPNYDDYKSAPAKTAASPEEVDSYFKELFKTAQPVLTDDQLDPFHDARKLEAHLAHQVKEADNMLSRCQTAFEHTRFQLGEVVKEAMADNIPLGHIVQAWSSLNPPPGLVKRAFEDLTPALTQKNAWGERAEFAKELSKVASAGAVVDESHPLMRGFSDYAQALVELEATSKVANEIVGYLQDLREFIKQAKALEPKKCVGEDCCDRDCTEHGQKCEEKTKTASRLDLEQVKRASFMESARQFGRNLGGYGVRSKEELTSMAEAAARMPQAQGDLIRKKIETLSAKNRQAQVGAAGRLGAGVGLSVAGLGTLAALKSHSSSSEKKAAAAPKDSKGVISKGWEIANRLSAAAGDAAQEGAHFVTKPLFDHGSEAPELIGKAIGGTIKAAPTLAVGAAGVKALKHLHAAGESSIGRAIRSYIPGTEPYEEDTLRTQMAWGAQPQQYY